MVRLFTDPRMLDHVHPGPHPERPERLTTVTQVLHRSGLAQACNVGTVREATDEELLRVHTPELLATNRRLEEEGGAHADPDTWIGPGSNLAARLAAGAAVEAVRSVLEGPDRIAFGAIRPPGHHARPARAMGFCLFDNIAVAAAEALEHEGVERVLIVDFDVHHGNGTQEIFYEDGRIGFLSLHRYPFYPGTGRADETGSGAGLGWIRNVPLSYGISRAHYRSAFASAVEQMSDKIRPDLLLISAGFDAHAADPIGDLGLEAEDFAELTRLLVDVAKVRASGRIVSLLEGGYDLHALAECVQAHVEALGVTPAFGPGHR